MIQTNKTKARISLRKIRLAHQAGQINSQERKFLESGLLAILEGEQ